MAVPIVETKWTATYQSSNMNIPESVRELGIRKTLIRRYRRFTNLSIGERLRKTSTATGVTLMLASAIATNVAAAVALDAAHDVKSATTDTGSVDSRIRLLEKKLETYQNRADEAHRLAGAGVATGVYGAILFLGSRPRDEE